MTTTVYVRRNAEREWRYSTNESSGFEPFATTEADALVTSSTPVATPVTDQSSKITVRTNRRGDTNVFDVVATWDGDETTTRKGYVKVKRS